MAKNKTLEIKVEQRIFEQCWHQWSYWHDIDSALKWCLMLLFI